MPTLGFNKPIQAGKINMQRLAEKVFDQQLRKVEILLNKAEKRDGKLVYTPEIILDRLTKLGVDLEYVKRANQKIADFIAPLLKKEESKVEAAPEEKPAPKAKKEKAPKNEE